MMTVDEALENADSGYITGMSSFALGVLAAKVRRLREELKQAHRKTTNVAVEQFNAGLQHGIKASEDANRSLKCVIDDLKQQYHDDNATMTECILAAEAERDRYREALERVADHTREAGQWELICIARNALRGEEECK